MSTTTNRTKASQPAANVEAGDPTIVQFPSSTKIVGGLITLLIAFIAWEATRTISKVDELSKEMNAVRTELVEIKTEIKTLTPLPEQISKLAIQLAEL